MAVNQNTTTANNKSWLDSFMGVVGQGANVWLGYQDQKNKAELDKIQAQNNFNNGQQQLAIHEQNQIRANMLLWGVFGIAVIVLFFILKKILR